MKENFIFPSLIKPFSHDDITAGVENELQTVVIGDKSKVDLPLTITSSNYYVNILKRARVGDTSRKVVLDVEKFLNCNSSNVWENSWIRFPQKKLSSFARFIFNHDLLADKKSSGTETRNDKKNFVFKNNEEVWLRVPMSYMLKLSLADIVGNATHFPELIKERALFMMNSFLNDNTSPEVISFAPVQKTLTGTIGFETAKETSKRFLLIQLLNEYAIKRWDLEKNCGEPVIYFSPLVPTRQKKLNEIISDSFYRELFMSPCLSGWNKGEEKNRYMHLCHKVLSLSHLNVLRKLKESGILTNNLIVFPNTSNVALANNGTHVSLGSKVLTTMLGNKSKTFTPLHEKYFGDLAIKIIEHFIPLFVNNFSASPMRIDFSEFHPERVLGFLPHELDYTHLRMLWRIWKKKASLKIFSKTITPFGPCFLDNMIGRFFNLTGDFVSDYRLIDYLITLASTNSNAALDGTFGNQHKVKFDLSDMGVFDKDMSFYLLYKLREFNNNGFSGFEGRFYSLFDSFFDDFAPAVNLQAFLTCFAYKLIKEQKYCHLDIPDDPKTESERRQFVFGSALLLPKLFIGKNTANKLLKDIVKKMKSTRSSNRYPGYLKIHINEYKLAMLKFIEDTAPELIEEFSIGPVLDELKLRIKNSNPAFSVTKKLISPILKEKNVNNPLRINSEEFNLNLEKYYRDELRIKQTEESFIFFKQDILGSKYENKVLYSSVLKKISLENLISQCFENIQLKNLSVDEIIDWVGLIVASVKIDEKPKSLQTESVNRTYASVY